MIAWLRFELWRTFWAGLILTLVLGAPLLTHQGGSVLGILYEREASSDLLRLSIAMPFLLAVLQFGLDRWLGLMPVLIHRGTPARKIQLAKTAVGLGWAIFFLMGVLALEMRLAVRSGQPMPDILEALWAVPQVLCLALLSWSAGEVAARSSKRGALATGLRIGAAYFALYGLHHWAHQLGASLDLPWGLWTYCALIGSAGALLWRYSNQSYGRPEPVLLPSEARLALVAALGLLCLWPNLDRTRAQLGRLMHLRLEPVLPSLQVDANGRVYGMEAQDRDFLLQPIDGGEPLVIGRRELKDFDSPPVLTDWEGLPLDLNNVRSAKRDAQVQPRLLSGSQRYPIMGPMLMENPPWESMPAAFQEVRRDRPVQVAALLCLPSFELVLQFTGETEGRRQRGESNLRHVQLPVERSDGQAFRSGVRRFDRLLVDLADGSCWLLEPERLGAALQPIQPPQGQFLAVEQLYSKQVWAEQARLSRAADQLVTSAGRWAWSGTSWLPAEPSEDLVTLEGLRRAPLPVHLSSELDVLGWHRARLIGADGQVLKEYDTARQGRSAQARRRTLLAARLAALPATAFNSTDPGLGQLDAGRGLPPWVRPVHLSLGLLAALLAWRLQRSSAGRLSAAAYGLLLGPFYVLALHLANRERQLARLAGPRGQKAPLPLFSDRSGEAADAGQQATRAAA
jgi:hypothetical protein